MSAYIGALIRRARLARNFSQEGLTRGICAASYLSKIEKGQIEAGQEILDRLFEALGISFVRDEALEKKAQAMLDSFFFRAEADLPCEEESTFFAQNGERLACSAFALSQMVVQLCMEVRAMDAAGWRERAQACWNELLPYMDCLDARLRRKALVAGAELAAEPGEALRLLEEAALLGQDSVTAYVHAAFLSRMGRYGCSTELAERAFSLACEEGNPWIMRMSSFLMGTNACNRYDLEQARACYDRAVALCRGYGVDITAHVRYNLGATYLELGDDEQAYACLHGLGELGGDAEHNMLLHQKLALLCARRGEREEAMRHIARARTLLPEVPLQRPGQEALYAQMLRLPELMLGDDPLSLPETEQVLLTLFEGAGGMFGHGFRQFYGRYLVEMYARQRRYKDALRVSENLHPLELS